MSSLLIQTIVNLHNNTSEMDWSHHYGLPMKSCDIIIHMEHDPMRIFCVYSYKYMYITYIICMLFSCLGTYCHFSIQLFTQNGKTPLMVASVEGHVDIVRMLIEANAQVNEQDEVCNSIHQKMAHNHILCYSMTISSK